MKAATVFADDEDDADTEQAGAEVVAGTDVRGLNGLSCNACSSSLKTRLTGCPKTQNSRVVFLCGTSANILVTY